MQKIHFVDEMQDLLWALIDENGFIVDCNMQKQIWVGFQVVTERLKMGEQICMGKNDCFKRYRFVVATIEPVSELIVNL